VQEHVRPLPGFHHSTLVMRVSTGSPAPRRAAYFLSAVCIVLLRRLRAETVELLRLQVQYLTTLSSFQTSDYGPHEQTLQQQQSPGY
jgi:hypothetical protein